MSCPSEETFIEVLGGKTGPAATASFHDHVGQCDKCSALLRAMADAVTSASDPAKPEFVVPPRIGRYVVGEIVGAGGMGVVYAAHDPELDRKIALKILGAVDAKPGSVRRMQREARAVAKLSHPNVIAVYDVGVVEGHIFLAMEFAESGTLRGWMKRESATWREVVGVFVQAGRGLAAAHAAGLVHRDFKPDNVLLDRSGRAKVADFGLAREGDDDLTSGETSAQLATSPALAATMTKTGVVLGTPAYMAPEQLRGDRADPRADVFAFCVALHEALYGVRPYAGTTMAALLEDIEAGRLAQPTTAAGVPAWLREVVVRGLSADPSQRQASMAEVVAALEAGGPQARRSRRTGLWLAIGAAGAAGIAAASIALTMRSSAPPPGPAFSASNLRRLTFEEGCEEYPTFLPDGKSIVYDAYADGADRLVRLDLASGEHHPITGDDAWRYNAAVSPDGKRVAFSQQRDEDWSTWVMALDGSGARELAKGEAQAVWTPDGRAIWAGDGPLERRLDAATFAATAQLPVIPGYRLTGIFELEDGRLVARLFNDTTHAVDRIVVFPHAGAPPVDVWHGDHEELLARTRDGKALVVSKRLPAGTHELWRVPLDGSAPSPLGATGVDATKGLAFSPDHTHMVWSTCATESVISQVVGSGAAELVFPKHEWNDFEATAVPGTSKLVALSDRGGPRAPWLLDASGHDAPRVIDVAGQDVSDFTVSRDGRWLAFTSAGHGVCAVPIDGSARPHCPATGSTDRLPAFSRDGTSLYFQTKRGDRTDVAVVPLAGGAEPKTVLTDARVPIASPTADVLVYLTHDGGVAVLDLATGKTRPLSPQIKPGVHLPRFSEDGKRVAVSNGATEIVEVDATTGAVVSQFATKVTPIRVPFYFRGRIAFTATAWRGDLWIADVAER